MRGNEPVSAGALAALSTLQQPHGLVGSQATALAVDTSAVEPLPPPVDFMTHGYWMIAEPLNLTGRAREWFGRACDLGAPEHDSMGLVLGGTEWLGRLLSKAHRHVALVDLSTKMLDLARADLRASPPDAELEFVQGDWLSMPALPRPVGSVVADNSFSFLPFPDGWIALCDQLADRMCPHGRLVARFLSVPPSHRPSSVDEIIGRFVDRDPLNYTEVRAALLLSHWREEGCRIDTEEVLETFEAHASKFDVLTRKCPPDRPNDLTTITKYRDTGAVYYAPPLGDCLEVFRKRFRVSEVHFGEYAMADYFPLVVAQRL